MEWTASVCGELFLQVEVRCLPVKNTFTMDLLLDLMILGTPSSLTILCFNDSPGVQEYH